LEYRQRQREGKPGSDEGNTINAKANAIPVPASKESSSPTTDTAVVESRKETESISSASSLEDITEPSANGNIFNYVRHCCSLLLKLLFLLII